MIRGLFQCGQMMFLLQILLLLPYALKADAYTIGSRSTLCRLMCTSNALLENATSSSPLDTSYVFNELQMDNLNGKDQLNGLESTFQSGFEAITKSDKAWLKKYDILKDYYTKHHHTLVPVADATLGRWVQRQRSFYKKGMLDESRIKALNEVKFVFDARNHNKQVPKDKKWLKRSWEERYSELKVYYEEHGHCSVPLKRSGSLGGWVQYQRQKRDNLSIDQIEKLDEIDFIWNVREHQWDQQFIQVKKFIETNGHSCIPSSAEYKSMQAWCGTQRKLFKMKKANSTMNCALTDERENRLNSINFDWQTSHEYAWQSRLEQLKKYKDENGHLDLSKSDGDLGVWADTQRTEMRFKIDGHHTHLNDYRIEQLERLGFKWSIRDG